MRVWLVRHAATSWSGIRYAGRSDPPLDEPGRDQAARLARSLAREIRGADVWSSPAQRAVETARILGPAVRIDPRLIEANFGEAEGLTFSELSALFPDLAARVASGDMLIDWPGGESFAALDERVTSFWESMLAVHTDAVVVSHGGPLRILIRSATGRDVDLAPGGFIAVDA